MSKIMLIFLATAASLLDFPVYFCHCLYISQAKKPQIFLTIILPLILTLFAQLTFSPYWHFSSVVKHGTNGKKK